jgi:HD-GYP domain-containing protein (c-di-GMP phosphodiesterase class II)
MDVPAATRDLLDRIVRVACRVAGAEEAVVFLREDGGSRALARVAVHCDGRADPFMEEGHDSALERALATGVPAAGEATGGLRAAAPLVWGGTVRGALAASGGGRRFGNPELDALRELADLAAAALEESERRERAEAIVDAGVAALVRAVDMRDDYTGRHSESVGDLARQVGEALGMSGAELWLLDLAAKLHDVGKIGVPDAILHKTGPLDAAEWALMRRHAELGAGMIERIPGLERVAPLVRSHHERWDGAGYPDGLAAEQIPLASRVVAACDAFQAMTTDRPYRDALDVDAALAELTACSGTQFDPAVVAAVRAETAGLRARRGALAS